jgi:hypothetical protein
MTNPGCIRCARPVKRAKPNEHPQCGDRIVDGVKWRWHCSRACTGKVFGPQVKGHPRTRASVVKQRASWFRRRLQGYIAQCEGVVTADGLVPIKAMVKVMAEIERKSYARGWTAAMLYQRTGMLPRTERKLARRAA